MNNLTVAVAVRKYPNLVQTYILRKLAGFRKLGIDFVVVAEEKGQLKNLPPIIGKYDLLRDLLILGLTPWQIARSLATLPLSVMKFGAELKQIASCRKLDSLGLRYRIKSILRRCLAGPATFDIIHSHSLSSHDLLFFKRVFSIPVVATYHGQVPRGVRQLGGTALKRIFDEVDAFFVNTNFAMRELATLGCSESKIHIVPQGLTIDEYPFKRREVVPGEPIRIVTVGRLSIEKGHHVALQGVANALSSGIRAEYHIVGTGPELDNLIRLAKRLSIENHVIFHGFTKDDDLTVLLADAHIFVLPSITTGDGFHIETQGVVLQEAQALGIPVLASRTGGIPEVLEHDVTGMLFDEGDSDALSALINDLATDPMLYSRLAEDGRKTVEERFDIDRVCRNLTSIYNKILER